MSSFYPLVQLDLLPSEPGTGSVAVPFIDRTIAMTADVAALLAKNSVVAVGVSGGRSEEHTSELQSLMRISYAVFCLKKKQTKHRQTISRKDEHCESTMNTDTQHP